MLSLPQPAEILGGALAFLRIGGILFALPIFGDSPTPLHVRILMALAITIGLYGITPPNWAPSFNVDPFIIASYVVKELTIGLVIGFFARVVFDGLLMAASFTAYQMGFGTANLFLPDLGLQVDAFTAFHRAIIMLMILILNLHHVFIAAIADTFKLIPGGAANLNGSLGEMIISLTAGIFTTAIQLAAPILVALMFTMAALGLAASTVPQMNVFVISFPVSFFVGMGVYIATLAFFPSWIQEHFAAARESIFAAVRLLSMK